MDLIAWAAIVGGCVLLLALVPIVHPGNGPLRTRIIGGVGCTLLAMAFFLYARAHQVGVLGDLLTSYWYAARTLKYIAVGTASVGIAFLSWWMYALLPTDRMTPRARRVIGYWYAAGATSVLVLSVCAVLPQYRTILKPVAVCAVLVALTALTVTPRLQKRFLRHGPDTGQTSE